MSCSTVHPDLSSDRSRLLRLALALGAAPPVGDVARRIVTAAKQRLRQGRSPSRRCDNARERRLAVRGYLGPIATVEHVTETRGSGEANAASSLRRDGSDRPCCACCANSEPGRDSFRGRSAERYQNAASLRRSQLGRPGGSSRNPIAGSPPDRHRIRPHCDRVQEGPASRQRPRGSGPTTRGLRGRADGSTGQLTRESSLTGLNGSSTT